MPKNDQIWPKIGIFGQFGPGHAGLLNALLWVGWWLWRAGCISQDTYLLYYYFPCQLLLLRQKLAAQMYIKNEEGVLSHESGLGRTLGQGGVSESRMISPRPLDEVSPDVPQGQGPVVNCWAARQSKSKSTKSSFPTRLSSRGCL